MSSGLRKHLKKLPWFLLYNYPKKLEAYEKIREHNKSLPKDQWIEPNAYRSASPMNELCDYINTWEKEKIKWNTEYANTEVLVINTEMKLDDRNILRKVKAITNNYSIDMRVIMDKEMDNDQFVTAKSEIQKTYMHELLSLGLSEEEIANYVIKVSYSSISNSKNLAWGLFSNYILQNIKNNSNPRKCKNIIEVPYKTDSSYEFLGKYYELRGEVNV